MNLLSNPDVPLPILFLISPDLEKAVRCIKPSYFARPDGIPPIFLKKIQPYVLTSFLLFTDLFRITQSYWIAGNRPWSPDFKGASTPSFFFSPFQKYRWRARSRGSFAPFRSH